MHRKQKTGNGILFFRIKFKKIKKISKNSAPQAKKNGYLKGYTEKKFSDFAGGSGVTDQPTG